MGTKIKLSETFGKRIAIHCAKAEQRKKLLEAYEKNGITWLTGRKATYYAGDDFCCDSIYEGDHCLTACEHPVKLWAAPQYYFKKLDYKIVEFDDVELGE